MACVEKSRNTCKVWQGNVKEGDHLEYLVDGRITQGNGMGGCGLDLCGLLWAQMADWCQHGSDVLQNAGNFVIS